MAALPNAANVQTSKLGDEARAKNSGVDQGTVDQFDADEDPPMLRSGSAESNEDEKGRPKLERAEERLRNLGHVPDENVSKRWLLSSPSSGKSSAEIGPLPTAQIRDNPSEIWRVPLKAVTLDKEEPFASGAGGEIFAGRFYGARVAVKRVPKKASELMISDLESEIKLLSRVRHPYIVQFFAFAREEPGNLPVLVMERIDGGTLDQLMASYANDGKTLPSTMGRRIAYELCCALDYLHNSKPMIIHRDLKPANVLLTTKGNVRLADFGLAMSISEKEMPTSPFKLTGETGSYRFMAPEVFRHEPYNEKVDVFSASFVFYQMFMGLKPLYQVGPVDSAKMVALHGDRPKISKQANPQYAELLPLMWEEDLTKRISMDTAISKMLAWGFHVEETHSSCAIS